jgi:ER membrane protein complex subunit 7
MILIAIFSLVMVVGMPYLMENCKIDDFHSLLLTMAVDPEVKAELEDMQKNQKGMASSATNLQNMDIASDFASWMAGTPKPKDQKTKK